ncbi:MAG: BMP family protein [Actinomycetota bacterium]
MKLRALLLALSLVTSSTVPASADERVPKVAVAYDIGFLGDNSFNDAVHLALAQAKKKYKLVEPFVREVPTNGTAVDRLSRLRFLAKSGYTLIIAVGPGYRETVRRVSMEYTETQFALINDRVLGQLNISNIAFNEAQGAFLAGVVAAAQSRRKSVGFIGSEPELLSSFRSGVRYVSSKVNVVNISYPDDIATLKASLQKIDIGYSTWDGDSTVLTAVLEDFSKKVSLILETPDQYFAKLPGAQSVVFARVNKVLNKSIDELVKAALSDESLIDVLDDNGGIYGREYTVKNGGLTVELSSRASQATRSQLSRAITQLKKSVN